MTERTVTEIAISRTIFDAREDLHLELLAEAQALQQESYEYITWQYDQPNLRPPAFLVTRSEQGKLGPKLIWVTYSMAKISRLNRSTIRFTREISGRRNGLYPRNSFTRFTPEIRSEVYAYELRAASLRSRISEWRKALKAAQAVLDGVAK